MKTFLHTTTLLGLSMTAAQAGGEWKHVAYPLDSGTHAGTEDVRMAYQQSVKVDNVSSMRLHLGDYDLGKYSFLAISSLEDGATQFHDAETLKEWQGSSVYFNGDEVEVALYVDPKDSGVFIKLEQVEVDIGGACLTPVGICGADNRVSSSDPAVGRFPAGNSPPGGGCTGWIISNGALLSAGHCTPGGVLQFNVPASDSDGTLNHPPAEDQYMVDGGSVVAVNNSWDDWAVYACFANTNTGLLPVQGQGSFYRVSQDSSPNTVRATGYGYDASPIDSQNWNSDHKTQQTSTGSYVEQVGSGNSVRIRFRVDVTCANSGGPLIVNNSSLTVGIVKSAGCENGDDGFNNAVGFDNPDLADAIQTFPGPFVTYIDTGHGIGAEDGSAFRPYDAFVDGIAGATGGDIVSIVRGSYPVPGGTVVSKQLLLQAPVGNAVIGN